MPSTTTTARIAPAVPHPPQPAPSVPGSSPVLATGQDRRPRAVRRPDKCRAQRPAGGSVRTGASSCGPLSGGGIEASAMSTSTAAAGPTRDSRADWRDEAACRDADPELFFPDGDIRSARAQVKMAKLICRGCPVSATCLSWALASGQQAGIWGGMTEDERRRLHRRGRGFRPAADSLT